MVEVLSPLPEDKEGWKVRRAISSVVRKVVVNAAIHRSTADLIEEVYIAGLYHGMKLSGPPEPPPRQRDYLELTPKPAPRRGRPRKEITDAK
jgi:hypothetical protein